MSKPYLVVVHAGDASLHPVWLATGGERNWDLVVHYHGDNPLRYPGSGDAMVRIDGKGPKWHALHRLFSETSDAWRSYEYVWLPDDDLVASCSDINRMFELVAGLDLHLAQPSLSWDSHAHCLLMVHNPNFALRYASFIEPIAPVFSRSLLRRATPTFRESLYGSALGYVWPMLLEQPARPCAILDRIQVGAPRRQAASSEPAPRGSLSPGQEIDQILTKHNVQGRLHAAYGGIDLAGKAVNLFDEHGDRFIYKLCEGYLGCSLSTPGLLGEMFAEHTKARQEFLNAAPRPTRTPAPARAPATKKAALPSVSIASGQVILADSASTPQPVRLAPANGASALKI